MTPEVPSRRRVVVAAALIRGGRVLACRRTSPPAAAGRWELPGGKVEPGEDPVAALVRELGEELGLRVPPDAVGPWWAPRVPVGEHHELWAAPVRLAAVAARPSSHDRLRWLAPAELHDVDWLEPDRPFLPHVRATLEG
ncbi:(deoxy)nucleoside triphosphate pyrophosphohydrolase [Nocardioides sp.]|uniref:(deoxy)nucleoside triphosphate pyrophosphohydrolase n=1 Tax=Nocardioides sp. TaxID=35761 RepID=UPI003515B0B2